MTMEIRLREIEEADLALIMRWRTDPMITRYMNTDPALTPEKQLSWLQSIRTDEHVRYWLIEIGGCPAGVINLADIDWHAGTSSWGYYIGEKKARSFQAALALEMSLYDYVFDILSFTEIHNEVFSLNAGVIKLHEACGNVIVREEKGEVEKNGTFYDVTHLSLTRETWFSIRDRKSYTKISFDTDRLHHIGIAVSDMEKSLEKFKTGGYRRQSEITDDITRKVRLAFVRKESGGIILELVAPFGIDSPVTGILGGSKQVATPYHLCYEVENIRRTVRQLRRQSYCLVEDIAPAAAFEGRHVAFLVSREAGLVELLEKYKTSGLCADDRGGVLRYLQP